jgi:hypothetical protein
MADNADHLVLAALVVAVAAERDGWKRGEFVHSDGAGPSTWVLSALTFELSGGQRRGALAARCNMYLSTSRPGCHAVGRPLERRVRPRL